jgi:hypothetical protein
MEDFSNYGKEEVITCSGIGRRSPAYNTHYPIADNQPKKRF